MAAGNVKTDSTSGVKPVRLKKCFRCDKPKPTTEFFKCRSNPDGLDRFCKKHRVQLTSRYHKQNKDKHNLSSALNRAKNKTFFQVHGHPPVKHPKKKVCPKCKQPRFAEEFQINKQRSSGRDSWCRYCIGPRRRSSARRWYNGNTEYVRLIRDPLRWQKISQNPFLHGRELDKQRMRQASWRLRIKAL